MRDAPTRAVVISIHAPRTGSDPPRCCACWACRHFNPRSPHGERREDIETVQQLVRISIHAPRTGSDPQISQMQTSRCYFNPRSPHGERPVPRQGAPICAHFNPRSPHGERHALNPRRNHARQISIHAPRTGSDPAVDGRRVVADISIHAPRTGSDVPCHVRLAAILISIHAPRTGSDVNLFQHQRNLVISIHAPRTGSDNSNRNALCSASKFQSTLPARGATIPPSDIFVAKLYFNPRSPHGERPTICARRRARKNFNPRSPHGERRIIFLCNADNARISIHAPRTGSDTFKSSSLYVPYLFQSTLPARGATADPRLKGHALDISIHAPRTGSDARGHVRGRKDYIYFNPRSPHGERPGLFDVPDDDIIISIHAPRTGSDNERFTFSDSSVLFQSTLPARGATPSSSGVQPSADHFNPRSPHGERPLRLALLLLRKDFNPRSPHGERRPRSRSQADGHYYFNPRSPHGERREWVLDYDEINIISIHAPRTGSDRARRQGQRVHKAISIHAPRTGSDKKHPPKLMLFPHFNPRSPHGERRDCWWETRIRNDISIHAPRTGSDG